MNSQNNKSSIRTLLEIAITIAIILTFILLTVVVMMLVTGSLHVINRNFFQLSFMNIMSSAAAIIILIISTLFLIKAFKKIRSSVINAVFHDNSEE